MDMGMKTGESITTVVVPHHTTLTISQGRVGDLSTLTGMVLARAAEAPVGLGMIAMTLLLHNLLPKLSHLTVS